MLLFSVESIVGSSSERMWALLREGFCTGPRFGQLAKIIELNDAFSLGSL